MDAAVMHEAMRVGLLDQLANEIASTQIGFVLELPGMRDATRRTLRDQGMETVTDRFFESTQATYVKTFGAALPHDLCAPFKAAFMKAAAEYVEAWLASDGPKS
jgi:hypothetical protein